MTNVPTIFKGKEVSEDEALKIIQDNDGVDPETGEKLPTYANEEEAIAAAKKRSREMEFHRLPPKKSEEVAPTTKPLDEDLIRRRPTVKPKVVKPSPRKVPGPGEVAPRITAEVTPAITAIVLKGTGVDIQAAPKAIQPSLTPRAKGKAVVQKAVTTVDKIFPGAKIFLIRVAAVESQYGEHRNTFRTLDPKGGSTGIFQTDRNSAFAATRDIASHPGLVRAHVKIKDAYGFQWNDITFEDLEKPLISALAARLFLLTIPQKIPTSIKAQAAYWKKFYNTSAGAGTEKDFIKRAKGVQ